MALKVKPVPRSSREQIRTAIAAIDDALHFVDHHYTGLEAPMADLYRTKVEDLAAALQAEGSRLEASEMLRGLIDSIVLMPDEGQLRIELRGNLAAMLTAAQKAKRSPETGDPLVPIQLVAGGGFEPPTFGL